jgi:hypothetical protein
MQPQGTGLVNAQYFAELTAQINSINVCSDLQEAVNVAIATLQVQVTEINVQISLLLPLITLPTDLGSVISWITNLAGPYIVAYNNYITQLTETLAAIAALTTAIENAAARIESCSITVPPIIV